MKKLLAFFFTFVATCFIFSGKSFAESETVKLGMSTALTGPSSFLGTNMKAGVESYIKMVNDSGGINGKKFQLIAYDDGYEPARTAPNMLKLIKQDKIFATIGNVGTPTSVPSIKISNQFGTPFFGPFTGAGILRKNPPDKWIFNYRASYAEETAKMVDILTSAGINPNEIAFFIQDDAFGMAGLKGGTKALAKHGVKLSNITVGKYKRNTVAVDGAVNILLNAPVKPKAIIMVGVYSPCSEFVIKAKDKGLDAIFLGVSFIGSKAMGEKLASKGPSYTKKVLITQVVPHYDSNLPVVSEYKANLKKYFPTMKPNFVSLEGYVAAKLFFEVVKNSGTNLTKEGFVSSAESLRGYDPGLNYGLGFSKTSHQASNKLWPTMFNTSGKEIDYDPSLLK